MELHEWWYHSGPILRLEEAIHRLPDGNNKGAHVEKTDDTAGLSVCLADFGLQLRLRCLSGDPAPGRVTDDEDVLSLILDQRLQDFENHLGILVALRIPTGWRSSIKVGLANIANIQFAEVSSRKLGTVSFNTSGFEGFNQWKIGGWRMVRAVANDHRKIGRETHSGNSNKIVVWMEVLWIGVRLDEVKG